MTNSQRRILCLNSGSSSIKFALFSVSDVAEQRLLFGAVENIGPQARVWLRQADKMMLDKQETLPGPRECIRAIFAAFEVLNLGRPQAAGHRIVHGGPKHTQPQKIDSALLKDLENIVPLAPLHLPAQIEIIRALAQHY